MTFGRSANLASTVLLLVHVLNLPSNVLCAAQNADSKDSKLPSNETGALLQLKAALGLTANWSGEPCASLSESRWGGIGCRNGHVKHIVLEGLGLAGSFPPAFPQNVPLLTKLSLKNNSLSGPLPSNLNQLVNLQALLLSHNHFSGAIPASYADLGSLIEIELQYNSLTGPIPPFNQSTIETFNVSHNDLQGAIPATRVLRRFPASSYDENADLCGGPLVGKTCPDHSTASNPSSDAVIFAPPVPDTSIKKKSTKLEAWSIALIVVAAALLVCFLAMLVFSYDKRRRSHSKNGGKPTGENAGSPGPDYAAVEKKTNRRDKGMEEDREEALVELEFCNREMAEFDMDDLLRASAQEIGKGKLGITFKAMTETGPAVAVKRIMDDMNDLSKKDFVQQMQLLGTISSSHENLARTISFYYSKEEKLIVSEFVPNGNLFQLLHENGGIEFKVGLSWSRRLSIVKAIANGLNFLHQHPALASQRVPHANLKSSNVLIHLDSHNNYHPKLTDFGFLPLLHTRKSAVKLAIGRSPEFFSTSYSNGGPSPSHNKKLTQKTDVYCFGIVLLEVITGRIPGKISPAGDEEEEEFSDLSDWVRMVVNSDWTTDILDKELRSAKEGHEEMLKLTEIALECTNVAPERRPKMSEVVRKIEEIEQRKLGIVA